MNYNVFAIPNGRMRGIMVSVLACGRLCVQYSVGTNTIHQLLFYDCLLRSKSRKCWFRITVFILQLWDFSVLIKGSNILLCYLVMDLIKPFWYLIHLEQ